MPRKTIQTTQVIDDGKSENPVLIEGQPVPTAQAEPMTREEATLETDLAAFLDSVGADSSKVTIYKTDRLSPQPKYMGSIIPSMCSEDYLQAEYGEGRYVLKFLNSEGRHLTSKTVYIGPPTLRQVEKLNPPFALPNEGSTQVQIELLKEEMRANREIVLKMIEAGNNGGHSSVQELGTIIELVRGMVTPPNAATVISDMVGVLKTGIELGNSGGKAETSMLDLVKEGLQALPGVFEMLKANKNGSAQAQPVPVNNAPAPQVADHGLQLLKNGINYLKTRIKAGHPVGHWVDSIMLNLDDPIYAILANSLDWPFEKFIELDPEVGSALYRPWFEELFKGLKDELSNRMDSSRPDGNEPNASGDGAAHK
jgi:hypothetical protein